MNFDSAALLKRCLCHLKMTSASLIHKRIGYLKKLKKKMRRLALDCVLKSNDGLMCEICIGHSAGNGLLNRCIYILFFCIIFNLKTLKQVEVNLQPQLMFVSSQ